MMYAKQDNNSLDQLTLSQQAQTEHLSQGQNSAYQAY